LWRNQEKVDIESVKDGFSLKKEITISDVRQICSKHEIEIEAIESIVGSFNKKIFFINNEFLLRVSGATMTLEQEKFRRVASLEFVPTILHVGVHERDAGQVFYTLLTLLPGDDFVNSYSETTLSQQMQLGKDLAKFLDHLNAFTGEYFDIGLYLPSIAKFGGTWRDGHQKYWDVLKQESSSILLTAESIQVFDQAFHYLMASVDALEYQTGPNLLHNDFHPRNILLVEGKLSGVIDWECSQYGETDFELCHFVHWCLYPPELDMDLRPFLRSFFQSMPECMQVPNLQERLTIYQIEHEIQQIIWDHKSETWRVPRLSHWLEGGVFDLFKELF
jgi:aminoglycoside phosphotransferase (APT) family kinase protein